MRCFESLHLYEVRTLFRVRRRDIDLSSGEIAVNLRSAHDPAHAATLERHGELGQPLATARHVAVNESLVAVAHRLGLPRGAVDP